MICYLFTKPFYLIFSADLPELLYYSHIPTTAIALLVGFYVFWNGKQLLLNRIFFAISIFFSLWTISNLIVWTNINSGLILFVWSFFGLLSGLLSIFSIYFVYVFLGKKDISIRLKLILLALLAPIFLFASTHLNLSGFNITACDAFEFENVGFYSYYTLLGILAMLWIFVLLIRKYRDASLDLRKQIILLGVGIESFLFFFFTIIFLTSYLTKIGVLPDSQLEMYGFWGMVIFIIYISILIVKFKIFNIKLLATQALVWGLVALIGSQFFFIKAKTNFILNGFGFLAAIILGQYLVKSVKKEIEQREHIETLLKQRESLVHFITHKVKGSFTRTKTLFAGMLDGTFGQISPEIKKRAEQGLEFDDNGIQTVNLVLNVANLQNGLIQYNMKPINFEEIVKQSITDKKLLAEERGLTIEEEIKEGDYGLDGDANWLKEVVNNLIDNSIRYTKEGKITVGLEKRENKILLSVKDTGIGINEEDKKNLFKEGGRGKNSVLVNVDSTGYGLFTVKLIVEAHGGKVWVESEGENRGSQFYVELPTINQ